MYEVPSQMRIVNQTCGCNLTFAYLPVGAKWISDELWIKRNIRERVIIFYTADEIRSEKHSSTSTRKLKI